MQEPLLDTLWDCSSPAILQLLLDATTDRVFHGRAKVVARTIDVIIDCIHYSK